MVWQLSDCHGDTGTNHALQPILSVCSTSTGPAIYGLGPVKTRAVGIWPVGTGQSSAGLLGAGGLAVQTGGWHAWESWPGTAWWNWCGLAGWSCCFFVG